MLERNITMLRIKLSRRLQSNYSRRNYLTAKFVRQQFLDYFSQEMHLKVRSSPVKPLSDPTLEFVNAGMNQVL